ncbi:pilus assembly protein PilM [Candidatus Berkiella cookevillensis]|uniref:Competence protein A n=1 Tax=Candidatus Berkiella cookevillensis TaxID=437022 RepID=A0A0Q9YAU9_9GAMM|nr:pilus assembly protein PilM [Candidatus Berkiella cookevillensis]MCS5709588.1 pilus assembly protein PilM [Candidatus Berkiella cookevillensis]
MFGLFERKTPPMVGIDISSCTVKLLELSQGPQGFRVESYGVETLAPNVMQEKEIKDIEAVGNAVDRLMKRSRAKSKFGAISVSGSAVITKVIQMNANLNDQELATQLQLEADRYIPYPLQEVFLDFQVLGPSSKSPDLVDVLLAASRAEYIETRVQALRLGGLTTKVVDIEAYAIERALSLLGTQLAHDGENKTIAVVDIGSSMTTLSVLKNKVTVYTRDQIFGGKQLTEEIQRRYGLSYEEAGRAKKQGGLPEDYQSEVLEPFKEGVVQQVSRSLQFFFSSSEYSEIDQIIMAGGTATIPGLVEKVQEKLGIPALLANPFTNMSIAPKVNLPALQADTAALMICCGLAMRSFQ